jgi:integrase
MRGQDTIYTTKSIIDTSVAREVRDRYVLLLLQGVHTKIVQERLGYASISITMDTYSHVLPSLQKEAAGKLDALLANIKDASPAA